MMTNPPASIDDEALTVEREIRIDAPQATVWAALTTPEHIAGWFGQQALFPDGVHTGARGTFTWPEHGPFPVQIVTFSPTEEFAFTWGTPGEPIQPDNATTATFTLREDAGQTVLRVVESGFDTLGDAAGRRRSEERRVGKECRAERRSDQFKEKRCGGLMLCRYHEMLGPVGISSIRR